MRSLFICLAILFSGVSQAVEVADMGLAAGWRMNDGTSTGNTVDGEGGLILGGLAYLPIADKFHFRTGFLYSQRHYQLNSSDVKVAYVDVPVSALWKVGDMGGVFFGTAIGLKVSESCGAGDCTDTKSLATPIQFGGHFKIAPQLALEVFYETLSGEIVANLEDATAVGAMAIITFE